jgi:antitoxin MazE
MKTQIIQIGNSQGVRLPKVLLEESGITGDVEIELHTEGILIRNAQRPRSRWNEAFRSMAENEDDEMIDGSPATAFEMTQWQW